MSINMRNTAGRKWGATSLRDAHHPSATRMLCRTSPAISGLPAEREISSLATYWSESTQSLRSFWIGLAPWEIEFPFPGSLISTAKSPRVTLKARTICRIPDQDYSTNLQVTLKARTI